jgi:hypothetical protein
VLLAIKGNTNTIPPNAQIVVNTQDAANIRAGIDAQAANNIAQETLAVNAAYPLIHLGPCSVKVPPVHLI